MFRVRLRRLSEYGSVAYSVERPTRETWAEQYPDIVPDRPFYGKRWGCSSDSLRYHRNIVRQGSCDGCLTIGGGILVGPLSLSSQFRSVHNFGDSLFAVLGECLQFCLRSLESQEEIHHFVGWEEGLEEGHITFVNNISVNKLASPIVNTEHTIPLELIHNRAEFGCVSETKRAQRETPNKRTSHF